MSRGIAFITLQEVKAPQRASWWLKKNMVCVNIPLKPFTFTKNSEKSKALRSPEHSNSWGKKKNKIKKNLDLSEVNLGSCRSQSASQKVDGASQPGMKCEMLMKGFLSPHLPSYSPLTFAFVPALLGLSRPILSSLGCLLMWGSWSCQDLEREINSAVWKGGGTAATLGSPERSQKDDLSTDENPTSRAPGAFVLPLFPAC